MRRIMSVFAVAAAAACWSGTAHAQFRHLIGSGTIIIKSGETLELSQVYWVVHCRSLLKSVPEVEVLDGPQQISVSVKEAMVLPRQQSCSKKVPGGMLVITAKDIEDPSYTHLAVRVTYDTKDGVRKFGHVYNLQLVP